MIYEMRDYILASQSFGTTVNWKKGLEEAIDIDPRTGKLTISKAFAEHVWELDNWSFSRGFGAVFPELAKRYHILDMLSVPVSQVNVEEFLAKRDRSVAR